MARCAKYQFGERRANFYWYTDSSGRLKKSDSPSVVGRTGRTRSSTSTRPSTSTSSSITTRSSTSISSSTATSSSTSTDSRWLVHIESESPPNTSLQSNAIAMDTSPDESSSELTENCRIKYEDEKKKFKLKYDAEMERINSEYEAAERHIKKKHKAHMKRIDAEHKAEMRMAKHKLNVKKTRIENNHKATNEMLEIRYCQISLPD